MLKAAAALGLAVVPRGTGSKLRLGPPPERADLVVETTGMNRVIEHAAGDLVASVEAGVASTGSPRCWPSGRPAARARPAGARRSRRRGTVGGVLATGVAGPLRLRYGTGRGPADRDHRGPGRRHGRQVRRQGRQERRRLRPRQAVRRVARHARPDHRGHVPAAPAPAATAYVTAECACPPTATPARRRPARAASLRSPPNSTGRSRTRRSASASRIEGDQAGVAQRALLQLWREADPQGGHAGLSQRLRRPGGARGPAGRSRTARVLQVAFWPGDLADVLDRDPMPPPIARACGPPSAAPPPPACCTSRCPPTPMPDAGRGLRHPPAG